MLQHTAVCLSRSLKLTNSECNVDILRFELDHISTIAAEVTVLHKGQGMFSRIDHMIPTTPVPSDSWENHIAVHLTHLVLEKSCITQGTIIYYINQKSNNHKEMARNTFH